VLSNWGTLIHAPLIEFSSDVKVIVDGSVVGLIDIAVVPFEELEVKKAT